MKIIAWYTRACWMGLPLLLLVPWSPALQARTTAADNGTAAPSAPQDTEAAGKKTKKQTVKTLAPITVTANYRAVPLQTAPVSATVLSAAEVNNLNVNVVDRLQFLSPSTTVNNFGQGNDFNIRGIGKGEHNTQTGTGVITYWDGVPSFPGYVNEQPYYDISSIQILRGPQGTFGGENAIGGAVLVNTNDPVIDGGHDGYVQGQLGNYGEIATQGAINLPISSTFAARIAFYGDNRGSFYHIAGPWTGTNARKRYRAARLSLLWQPDSNLSVLFKTDLGYFDNGALIGSPIGPGYPPIENPFDVASNANLQSLDRMVRSILRVDYKFGDGYEFRSITGYQRANTKWQTDLDGTAIFNYVFRDSVYETMPSQEFDLLSPTSGRLSWIVGTFWQWNKYTFPTGEFFEGLPPGNPATEYVLQGTNPERNRAVFGQIEYNLTDKLKLEVGARYTQSSTTNYGSVNQFGVFINNAQTASYDNTSGKVSLGWKVNDRNYLYALVATGFRPGGLNVPVGLGPPKPFGAEKLVSQEVGWKAQWFDDHLRTQIDAFHNHYENFQVTVGYPALPTFGFELNVPHPTQMHGLEIQLQALFGDWSLFANAGWLHSSLGQLFATDPRLPSVLPCDPLTGPASITCIDLEGREQTYGPDFTYNFGLQRTFHVGGDTIVPRVNFAHISSQWATLFENIPLGDRLGSRNVLGASIDWTHGSWVMTLYGTNLTDEHYVSANLIGAPGFLYYGPPRQYGIRVTKYF